ncbi:hypothetical protein MCUN1_001229 [Malassezia cuniculi]|uniref:TAFII55 protein conserved region domain-containing protein n=1 Tax=Malassezia cuniculi TaxID=948313 RepID=A0AAF0EQB5_9BASI|nr:hypothetical protein MCUN1_001229 [Malassezia cuniculi]
MSGEAASSAPRARGGFRKPRVRLNFSRNIAGAHTSSDGPKTKPYMQGYDRELDSEDDETGDGMAFEEQLILRLPEGPGIAGELDELRSAIRCRSAYPDVWFKFKDSRRAVFHVGTQLYAAKLVDMPTVSESYKTLDNKQMFKIADISQMLLVERPITQESEAMETAAPTSGNGNGNGNGNTNANGTVRSSFNIDDFIYPHGITPPMRWARKRRFRRRIHNRTIEAVEKEVEALLNDDKRAEKVEYEYVDAATADAIEREIADERNAAPADSDSDGHGSDGDGGDDGADEENVDQDLAAELDAALAEEEDDSGSSAQSGSDLEDLWDDDEGDDGEAEAEEHKDKEGGAEGAGEGEEDADEGEDGDDADEGEAERRVRESQLDAECREIDAHVRRKQHDVESTQNALLKSRHQQALRKLMVEHELKKKQLSEIRQLRRTLRKERAEAAAEAPEAQHT